MTIQQTPLRRPALQGEGSTFAARAATVALIMVLAYMLFQLLLGKANVIRVHAMGATLSQQLATNEAARKRNEKLAAEVQELNEGLTGVEEQARESLGMVKPNEIFVSIIPETPQTK